MISTLVTLLIIHKFRSHLASLYSAANESNPTEANTFFSRINLPELSQAQRNQLEDSVTVEEVSNAIKEQKLNKRPCPDGYSAIYYKKIKIKKGAAL